jgi:hypothetical protein
MVSIKVATEKAIAFAREVLGPEQTRGIRLEEVESTNIGGKDAWLITLSTVIPDEPDESIVAKLAGPGRGRRAYKSFTVLKSNGDVKSMKIRDLAGA